MSWGNKRSYDDWGGSSWKDNNQGAYWTNKRPRNDDWNKDDRGNGKGKGKGRRRDREPYKTKEDLDEDLEKYFGRSTENSGKKSLDNDLDSYMGRKASEGEEVKKEEEKPEEVQADEAEKAKEDS